MNQPPTRFISDPVTVEYDQEPLLEKKPRCPDRFVWNGAVFAVDAMLAEWHDYTRRGRMARNMRPSHLRLASQRGSWGVGRAYFRVRVASGRIFDLYYDRAPGSSDDRKGRWVLYRELLDAPPEV